MTDITLDRSDDQGIGVGAALSEDRCSSGDIDWVTSKGTGAMTFQIAGFMEVYNACCCVGSANRHSLSFSGRAGNTCCVDRRGQKSGRVVF